MSSSSAWDRGAVGYVRICVELCPGEMSQTYPHSWYPLQPGCGPQGLSRIEASLDVNTHPEFPIGALEDTLGMVCVELPL